ncbi:probable calcium-binding protein CML45 [Impatiens glandulifera]|uniref:probable calcium-binding protein CML45 n=1 Tax=Impatiens glandulifera TaxID=253017 RepID=UPI001FB12BEE|nr:probable calcium-binding protein CML45 [Impatiens glandulifera]
MSTFPIEKPTTINMFSMFPALIFFRFFVDWAKKIYKNLSKSQLCVQSELGGLPFLNELVKAEEGEEKDSDMLREEYGGGSIRREDVEMVMGRMGFCFNVEDDEDENERVILNSEQMSKLFEEKEASLEEVKAAFDVFDENQDGFLDSEEVQRVVCNLMGFKVGSGFQEMIRPFDLNGDGKIDFQEFVKLMENSFCS